MAVAALRLYQRLRHRDWFRKAASRERSPYMVLANQGARAIGGFLHGEVREHRQTPRKPRRGTAEQRPRFRSENLLSRRQTRAREAVVENRAGHGFVEQSEPNP